ncbi:MAG: amidohydrolase family protein [Victivallales bacterium]
MERLFEYKDVDRRFYLDVVRDFLPDNIIDVHTHLWAKENKGREQVGAGRNVTWPSRVADECSLGDLQETYRIMFPGKNVTPLVFAGLPERSEVDAYNLFVQESVRGQNIPALIFSDPAWSPEKLETEIISGKFCGAKSYLSLAPDRIPAGEICIYDFFPREHLKVLNRHGLIVMLHLPRKKRLADPLNISQLMEIERDFPDIKLIVAHVGRAYCRGDMGDAFKTLSGTEKMFFDISANTNALIFEELIKAVGPKRILFGSDMPISRMRMRRIEKGGIYVNIVPRGLYGDLSGDPNMMEVDGGEAERLSFFIYEEIAAFKVAAEKTGLSKTDVENVFYTNSKGITGI